MYFFLMIICVLLLLVSDNFSLSVRDAILPMASEGFKLVLAALIGAISAVIGVNTRPGNPD